MTSFSDPICIAANIIAKQAYTHAVSILFGFTEDPKSDVVPDIHIASAGLIDFQGFVCAVTCNHVLESFYALEAKEPKYKFQIGSFICDPRSLLRDSSDKLDLAVLDVSSIPPERLRNRSDSIVQPWLPVRWPNDPVRAGDLVVLCGFPKGTREVNVLEKSINSVAFPLIEPVASVDADSFIVSFSRKELVNTGTDESAPDDIQNVDVNGLSGSPVFSSLRNVRGAVGVMEFVGTVLAEIPKFEPDDVDGLRVRSSRFLTADGLIAEQS